MWWHILDIVVKFRADNAEDRGQPPGAYVITANITSQFAFVGLCEM